MLRSGRKLGRERFAQVQPIPDRLTIRGIKSAQRPAGMGSFVAEPYKIGAERFNIMFRRMPHTAMVHDPLAFRTNPKPC